MFSSFIKKLFTSMEAASFDENCILAGFHPRHYVITGRLGIGNQGVVSKLERIPSAAHLDIPGFAALKNVPIKELDGTDERECHILRSCRHENVLRLFYWKIVTPDPTYYSHLHLYTELCESNLGAFLQVKDFPIDEMMLMCRQMMDGCEYLHDMEVVHRDINPNNILVTGPTVKIADFGYARYMPSHLSSDFRYTTVVTKRYASPEMTQAYNRGSHTQPKVQFATDIFSLGVVIYQMVTKGLPFSLEELGRSEFDPASIVSSNVSHRGFAALLTEMLLWDPELRPAARELPELMYKFQPDLFIYVKTLTGDIIRTTMKPSNTVMDLTKKIHQMEGIETDKQRLIFAAKQLEAERLLSYYNIPNESTIQLVLRNRGGNDRLLRRTFHIRMQDGKDLTLTTDDCRDIAEVKRWIYRQREIPVAQQRLIFCGKWVEDDFDLMSSCQESSIYLVHT